MSIASSAGDQTKAKQTESKLKEKKENQTETETETETVTETRSDLGSVQQSATRSHISSFSAQQQSAQVAGFEREGGDNETSMTVYGDQANVLEQAWDTTRRRSCNRPQWLEFWREQQRKSEENAQSILEEILLTMGWATSVSDFWEEKLDDALKFIKSYSVIQEQCAKYLAKVDDFDKLLKIRITLIRKVQPKYESDEFGSSQAGSGPKSRCDICGRTYRYGSDSCATCGNGRESEFEDI